MPVRPTPDVPAHARGPVTTDDRKPTAAESSPPAAAAVVENVARQLPAASKQTAQHATSPETLQKSRDSFVEKLIGLDELDEQLLHSQASLIHSASAPTLSPLQAVAMENPPLDSKEEIEAYTATLRGIISQMTPPNIDTSASASLLPEGRPLQRAPGLPTHEEAERFLQGLPVIRVSNTVHPDTVERDREAPNQEAYKNRQQDSLDTKPSAKLRNDR